MADMVNHPKHYEDGATPECWDVYSNILSQKKFGAVGGAFFNNDFKYAWRTGSKGADYGKSCQEEKTIEDLEKVITYAIKWDSVIDEYPEAAKNSIKPVYKWDASEIITAHLSAKKYVREGINDWEVVNDSIKMTMFNLLITLWFIGDEGSIKQSLKQVVGCAQEAIRKIKNTLVK